MDKGAVFCSDRLTFRGISRDDAELIVEWRSEPENYKNFFSGRAITLEEHLAWFNKYLLDNTRFDFVIIDENGLKIGTVGISAYDGVSCEINYIIGEKAARGKGYAQEAVSAVTRLAFDDLGVERVYARILAGNCASAHVAEGAGYELYEWVYRCERH